MNKTTVPIGRSDSPRCRRSGALLSLQRREGGLAGVLPTGTYVIHRFHRVWIVPALVEAMQGSSYVQGTVPANTECLFVP